MDDMRSALAHVEFFRRGQDIKLTEHFHLREFECKCKLCKYTLISLDHVYRLSELRLSIKAPIRILSAYRCHNHNENMGGERHSMHTYGLATDIYVDGLEPATLAARAGAFDGIGIYDGFVHVDSRGFVAFWDKRSVGRGV